VSWEGGKQGGQKGGGGRAGNVRGYSKWRGHLRGRSKKFGKMFAAFDKFLGCRKEKQGLRGEEQGEQEEVA